jgi:hypothetical protein
VTFVASIAIYFFERDAAGSDIQTYGDSLFWTATQISTVSSSMNNPLTTGGRISDVVIEFFGVFVIAMLAGSFGSFFHRVERERERATAEQPPPNGPRR